MTSIKDDPRVYHRKETIVYEVSEVELEPKTEKPKPKAKPKKAATRGKKSASKS